MGQEITRSDSPVKRNVEIYVIVGLPDVFLVTEGNYPAYAYMYLSVLRSSKIYICSQKEMEDGRFVPYRKETNIVIKASEVISDKPLKLNQRWRLRVKGGTLESSVYILEFILNDNIRISETKKSGFNRTHRIDNLEFLELLQDSN